jgi:hypothetical protein
MQLVQCKSRIENETVTTHQLLQKGLGGQSRWVQF